MILPASVLACVALGMAPVVVNGLPPFAALQGTVGTPPRVVETTPRDGAVAVRPGDLLVRVVFDRPVRHGSYSITDVSATTPLEVTAPPRLSRDGRVFELRVRVAPGRRYGFSVNNPRYQNFRGLDGSSVAPHRVVFVTRQ
ncbi:Ig-like domain-containing protein [Sphingomonas qomolangmaensis]|uniref:Ig-like domain-containing protein n=1 Tax=Sphingomonas qomolangmaensis TaxID=2918765 RepID=A0ABY5LC76_9SPHN|nr:Ig-like domain-containing protein [Sphingomonas qomolangmaensis]UUL84022.1 Ig-like domain-containing protein [Sphingomonas qomolangmaensis]